MLSLSASTVLLNALIIGAPDYALADDANPLRAGLQPLVSRGIPRLTFPALSFVISFSPPAAPDRRALPPNKGSFITTQSVQGSEVSAYTLHLPALWPQPHVLTDTSTWPTFRWVCGGKVFLVVNQPGAQSTLGSHESLTFAMIPQPPLPLCNDCV